MAGEKNNKGHTTRQELEFIAGIKSLDTLRGYLAAAQRRSDWSGMDSIVVLAAARERLRSIEKRMRAR